MTRPTNAHGSRSVTANMPHIAGKPSSAVAANLIRQCEKRTQWVTMCYK